FGKDDAFDVAHRELLGGLKISGDTIRVPRWNSSAVLGQVPEEQSVNAGGMETMEVLKLPMAPPAGGGRGDPAARLQAVSLSDQAKFDVINNFLKHAGSSATSAVTLQPPSTRPTTRRAPPVEEVPHGSTA